MTTPAPSPAALARLRVSGFSLARLGRLVSKEWRESLRDRRTLVTLVLMPLLLYPLLGMVFVIFFRSPILGREHTSYRLGFRNQEERSLMANFLLPGETALRRDQGFKARPEEKALPEAGRKADSPDPLPPHQEWLPGMQLIESEDLEAAVATGQVDVGLRLLRTQGMPQMGPDRNQTADWEMLYSPDRAMGREAVRYLSRLVGAANGEYLAQRLRAFGVGQRLPPARLEPRQLLQPHDKRYSLLGALLPLVLVLMTITGAVYPAIDLTAGERERGTLEILMAAPIPRLSVLLAKYVAVLTVALLTALMNLAVMTATLLVLGGGPYLFTSGFAIALILVEVLGLLVLFAAFFSAVLLSLTSMTRSFKEAQAYLIPLMLVALTPGLLALLPGLKLEGVNVWVPLLNIVLLARDLLDGTAQPLAACLVVVITMAYAVAALALAARVFGRSAVAG